MEQMIFTRVVYIPSQDSFEFNSQPILPNNTGIICKRTSYGTNN